MKLSNNKSYILFLIGAYIVFFLAISRNLFTPYLSYDEAGQFWIAKGLNHDSEPMSSEKGVLDVIENNKYYNLDPGGFGILLHYWAFISNHHVWLRMLPFFFFIGVVVSFIYLSFLWIKNIKIAILMGFIAILSPKLLYMGFELRAYSMECLGTLMGVIALEKLNTGVTYQKLLLWSCVFSFFMTSRYSEILILFVVSLYVLYLISKSKLTLAQKGFSIFLYSIPLFFTLVYVYFFALVFQNKDMLELNYLPYLSRDISILVELQNVLAILFLALFLVLLYQRHKYSLVKKYQSLIFVTLTSNLLFITLSILGKHPWSLSGYRCISLLVLFIICFVAVISEIVLRAIENSNIFLFYLLSSFIAFILYLSYDNLFVRSDYRYNEFYGNLTKLDFTKYNRVLVEYTEAPAIKYLYEYGKFQNKKERVYPNKFSFQRGRVHPISKNKTEFLEISKDTIMKYDLLIMPAFTMNYNYQDSRFKPIYATSKFFEKY
ncbi:hypothetical protein [Runella aurantiaca]|uniref:Glycosyltransferase RgtA/B/C/D-like domain-containing protein n=1 Tax=Runella aurantiaca TaxID=2282308 RepID=A0A369I7X4_9BACT|nr:hypothetical protein [Runella aurantiaca]RDB04345.1 hypothetical protein DVG78_19300 [Runella aurantiaca]